jgi:transcriptional regulator with XRE-family HTH domain
VAPSDREELIRELQDRDARKDFAEDFLDSYISLQIKALRLQRGWSQEDLAQRLGTGQSMISRLENANNSSWTIATLKKLASAFELPLDVEFGKWSDLVDRSSNLSRESLERPSFSDDPGFKNRDTSSINNNNSNYDVPNRKILPFKAIPKFTTEAPPSDDGGDVYTAESC